jgi:hypothetical protein
MDSKNFNIFKNFGINEKFFNMNLDVVMNKENTQDIYVIQKDPIKKNFSEGAIYKIPSDFMEKNFTKAKDDMEIYEDCDQDYSVFDSSDNFNTKIKPSSGHLNLFTLSDKKYLKEKNKNKPEAIYENDCSCSNSIGELSQKYFVSKEEVPKNNSNENSNEENSNESEDIENEQKEKEEEEEEKQN